MNWKDDLFSCLTKDGVWEEKRSRAMYGWERMSYIRICDAYVFSLFPGKIAFFNSCYYPFLPPPRKGRSSRGGNYLSSSESVQKEIHTYLLDGLPQGYVFDLLIVSPPPIPSLSLSTEMRIDLEKRPEVPNWYADIGGKGGGFWYLT